MLGLPSMDILKDLYTKRDELYSPICWSQVGTIMRDLNLEVGKRGVINEEVIEDFYKSYSNKRYKEIYKAGSHIVSKAQKLGIHDLLVKKYNIIYDYNMGEEKYKSLLECVSYKDTIDKGYKSIYGRLMVTKNDELIKEYTGHFIKLRPDSFTFQEGLEYINSLKEYPKKTVSGKDINNGIYRYVFNRNKELFYQYILEKFKDNVPMLFLKDDDKLKRIEKQITECKIYNDWYKKYKSSHEPILTRLNRMDMVEHLNLTKKFKEYNNEAIDEIMKKYVGKRWQDVRKNDYKFLQYLYERPELKDQLFLKYNMVEDPRWTKRKSN